MNSAIQWHPRVAMNHLMRAVAVVTFALTFSATVAAGDVDDLTIITEHYPPYNIQADGSLTGIAVDLMAEILRVLESGRDRESIHLWPWARGYQHVLNKPNSVLFSTTRTQAREPLFKWVGPISPTTISLIARKDRNISVDSIDDLRQYRIGVVVDDIGEQLLLNQGFTTDELDRVSGTEVTALSINKLNRGRIDVWSYEQNVALWEIRQQGYDLNDYEVVYVLHEAELYYAFHRDTTDDVLMRFQAALDQLKQSSAYDGIVRQYLE